MIEVGNTYVITVREFVERGVIVELADGSNEFIHISKISTRYVTRLEDFVQIGDTYEALCVLSKYGKPELSLQHLNLISKHTLHMASKDSPTNTSLDDMIESMNKVFADKQKTLSRKQPTTNRRKSNHTNRYI